MSRIAVFQTTLVLLGVVAAPATAQAADVTVTRTKFGVPHIKADSFRAMGYGYGRSVAADNICTLADIYVTVNAERSKFFGPDATYSVGGNGTSPSNLNSDFVFQRYKDRGTVEALIAQPPPVGPRAEVAEGLQGYVDGYNDWLASVGGSAGVPDPTCRGQAWVRPITLLDAFRRVHQLAILGSSGAAIDGIGGAQPPGTATATATATGTAARAGGGTFGGRTAVGATTGSATARGASAGGTSGAGTSGGGTSRSGTFAGGKAAGGAANAAGSRTTRGSASGETRGGGTFVGSGSGGTFGGGTSTGQAKSSGAGGAGASDGAKAIAKLPASATPAQRAKALPPNALDDALGGLGSNAYAIGKDASQDGHGLLYGNPHFPWGGSERFYQSHLTIPGVTDVTGGSLLGVPIVLIGATKGVAWSHTVSTARRFVPYEVSLLPGKPDWYFTGGKFVRMKRESVTVQVKTADGSLEPRTRTLYSTIHGPITESITGLKLFPWNRGTAYALYDGNADNFGRMINVFFGMNLAQSVADVDANLKKYTGMPWVNTVASDTAGNAYYADIGNVPGISNTKYQSCLTVLGKVTDAAQRLPVLDGGRADCLPSSDADSVVPKILGPSRLPSLTRTDWTANMNDSYWLANPAQPLTGFPRIIGDEKTTRTLRTRIGIKQVQQRVLGTDGLAGKGFNLDNLREVAMGNRVYSAELWRGDLVRGCIRRSCTVLAAWDMRNDLDSPGAVLWQRFVANLLGTSPIPLPVPLGPYARAFSATNPVNTPSGLNTLNPTVEWALKKAEADMYLAKLPFTATLRTAQTTTRGGEAIPIHGGPGSSGIFNVFTPVWDKYKGYTDIVSGGSFIQAVHLTPGCPEIRTMVTYGQSTNPESPYYSDQTRELLSKKQWNTLPFCEGDVEREAISTDAWSVPGT